MISPWAPVKFMVAGGSYTGRMVRALVGAVRFFWVATAGHRLRPWRSEYLRWRVETYSGKPAGTLRVRDFLQVFLAEPRQFLRFFGWSGRMRRIAGEGSE